MKINWEQTQKDSPKEAWRGVIGYEDFYEVSNLGRVRSLSRMVRKSRGPYKYKGRILKSTLTNAGYFDVGISIEGDLRNVRIHKLVALAFVDNPDRKPHVNHVDGNKQNNHAKNLEWVTHRENILHAMKIGTFDPRGENTNLAKLTNKDVVLIRALHGGGRGDSSQLAENYGVSWQTIDRIVKRRTWKHI